ncbi:MAG TPA: hypothetical protein VE870_12345 [Bacteroidales bacterium]|nr:hypothetical protein [Bacteroidales bacterium]
MVEQEQAQNVKWYIWVIIILVAIIAILLYVGTFGNVDITSENKGQEKSLKPKPTNCEIKSKHEKLLNELIQKREKIYVARRRIYKIVYFSIRLIAVSIWVFGNLLLYFEFGIHDIGTIIDYNNGLIILLVAVVFLLWGILGSVKEWIKMFEKRLELWIFKKFIKLPELIEKNRLELVLPENKYACFPKTIHRYFPILEHCYFLVTLDQPFFIFR